MSMGKTERRWSRLLYTDGYFILLKTEYFYPSGSYTTAPKHYKCTKFVAQLQAKGRDIRILDAVGRVICYDPKHELPEDIKSSITFHFATRLIHAGKKPVKSKEEEYDAALQAAREAVYAAFATSQAAVDIEENVNANYQNSR